MNTKPNKHGFVGVRKRPSVPFRSRPYYARYDLGQQQFIYSKGFATPEEAAEAYQEMKRSHWAEAAE